MHIHKIEKITACALMSFFLLSSPINGSAQSSNGGAEEANVVLAEPSTHHDKAFNRRVAGSYFIQLQLAGFPVPLLALATITEDGGAVATDTDDFGFIVGGFHSPKHGVWKRSGRREITIRILEFAYSGFGGPLTTIFDLRFVAQFNEGLNDGSGSVTFKAFLPSQDPLDPATVPVSNGAGTFTFRRIEL